MKGGAASFVPATPEGLRPSGSGGLSGGPSSPPSQEPTKVAKDSTDTPVVDATSRLSENNKNKLNKAGKDVGVPALAAASVALSFGFQKHRGLVGMKSGSAAAVAPGIVGGALLPVLVGAVIMYRNKGATKKALTCEKAAKAVADGDPGAGSQANAALAPLTSDETDEAVVEGVAAGAQAKKAKSEGRSWNPFRDLKFEKPSWKSKSAPAEDEPGSGDTPSTDAD